MWVVCCTGENSWLNREKFQVYDEHEKWSGVDRVMRKATLVKKTARYARLSLSLSLSLFLALSCFLFAWTLCFQAAMALY